MTVRPPVDPDWWTRESFHGRPLLEILRDQDIASLLKFLKARGLGHAAMAAATGLSESRVRALLSGQQRVTSYEVLARIADGLGIERGLLGLAYTGPAAATSVVAIPGTESSSPSGDGQRNSDPRWEVSLPLRQLPADIADFTGRAELVADLTQRLTAPSPMSAMALCAIHGKGGLGKTTLAVHVAHRVQFAFPDGQLYADLQGVEAEPVDASRVLGPFLMELCLSPDGIPDHLSERARLFRSVLADRRVLVVLDNARDERQVRPLLPGTSSCAVIVTSRRRLSGLAGAAHTRLDSMTTLESGSLLAAAARTTRVETEPKSASEIVELCGRLPLALRIIGSRIAARSSDPLTVFVERLRDERSRLNLLRAGDLEVRSCFALSYETCDGQLRRAFGLLGLLGADDFAASVLACLADVSVARAEEMLERLVDAELVEIAASTTTGRYRYRLHDLLRLFARERLANEFVPNDVSAAVERLLTAYAELGANAAALLEPGGLHQRCATRAEALTEIEEDPYGWAQVERQVFVSGVRLAAEHKHPALAWRLAELVPVIFRGQADWAQWEQAQTIGLEAATASRDVMGQARMRCGLGLLRRAQGRYRDAIDHLMASHKLFEQIGDEVRAAIARRHLGDTHRYTGRLHDAVREFSEALTVFEKTDMPRLMAGALNGLGDVNRGLSRWSESEQSLQRCIDIYDNLGDRLELARAKVRLAILYRDRCRFSKAEALYQEGLAVIRELGDRRWEARTTRHLGIVARNTGQTATAIERLQACLDMFEEIADRRGVAVTMRNLGDTYRRATDYGRAEDVLIQALDGFKAIGDARWQARTMISLADTLRHRRAWNEAAEYLDQAFLAFQDIEDEPGQARTWRSRGILYRDQERWHDAVKAFSTSEHRFITLGDRIWAARVIAGKAATLRASADESWYATRQEADLICREEGATSEAEIDRWLYEW